MDFSASSEHGIANLIYGFIAGFLATLVFHQAAVALLWSLGVSPFAPFALSLTKPFGVPAFLSLAFWGGIWGMVFALIEGRFPHGIGYWISAFLFGAILASMVALTIVLPLKGKPMGGGWHLSLVATAFLANGAWGLGTGALLRAFKGWLGKHHHQAPV